MLGRVSTDSGRSEIEEKQQLLRTLITGAKQLGFWDDVACYEEELKQLENEE